MKGLLEKRWIDVHFETLPLWQQSAFTSFSSMIADEDNTYPCFPARHAFLSNYLRFSFVGDPRELSSLNDLANCLRTYGKCSRDSGKNTALAIFLETPEEIIEDYDWEDYRKLFWSILNQLTIFDEKDWPTDMPIDPSHHKWAFCFDGEPYFIFCATPAHRLRKSRHFPSLLIVFQPRWVFDEINNSTDNGLKMRKLIRKRLVAYDGISVHPDLKWYGKEDNLEWKQYFLSNDDISESKCPFMSLKGKL
ncbi:YqcI/YcgG family protein [Viridibacillus sp. FSL R5-0477]|uniref:YqcI/YcgG family protein n=1 Tax=Viridibacillus arenosi FSL R5-213 TaxID=1227360 RepID=W4EYJ8_9BACL|nr:YqcI/YcgG family protein [Viridibacillus arenosi]ETT85299.1 hypothetical protein C176_11399 [Viridibacillus arenosi FSL R5-213]OMC89361.1 hypothetical protein BK137_18110 [Viridibacillus arenosi]